MPRRACNPGTLWLTPKTPAINTAAAWSLGLLACLGAAGPAAAGVTCQVFFDKQAFEAFNTNDGKFMKGLENFEPPVSTLDLGEFALLADPLEGGVPNTDASGEGFPNGLVNTNLTIQSNFTTQGAPDVLPGSGLAALGPGSIFGNPVIPNSVKVGAIFFSESTDLIFTAGSLHTGVGFTVEDPEQGQVVITVFNEANEEIFSDTYTVPVDGSKFFFGIWCSQSIGRINVGGNGQELVDEIQMWQEQSPSCPWDCGPPPDKEVGINDFLAVIGTWGVVDAPCDFDGDGVGITDFLKIIGTWGPCPAPPNDECVAPEAVNRASDDGTIDVLFDMYGATPSPEAYQCLGAPPIHKDVWFCLTNITDVEKLVSISTSVDLFIDVNAGCTCPPGPPVTCARGIPGTDQFLMQPGEQVQIRLINDLNLPNAELIGTMTILNEPAGPGDQVTFYTVQEQFLAAAALAGKVSKFTWSFEPTTLPAGGAVLLDDVQDIDTHASDPDDPWGDLWPPDVDNVGFSSNLFPGPGGSYVPRGADGLLFAGPGVVPELTNYALLANTFVDSFEIISGPPAGDNHTAMSMDLVSVGLAGAAPVLLRVTVFDKTDQVLGSIDLPALAGDKIFLGLLTDSDAITIGRVDVWDVLGSDVDGTGAEGVSTITAYWQGGPP